MGSRYNEGELLLWVVDNTKVSCCYGYSITWRWAAVMGSR